MCIRTNSYDKTMYTKELINTCGSICSTKKSSSSISLASALVPYILVHTFLVNACVVYRDCPSFQYND